MMWLQSKRIRPTSKRRRTLKVVVQRKVIKEKEIEG